MDQNNHHDGAELPDFQGDTRSAPAGRSALEAKQELLSHHVKMVARKLSHSLLVFGSQPGLGKTRTILRTLDAEGVEPILVNSHVTPLALYSIFFQHREEAVLFMDDVDSVLGSMPHLGLLRSALWGNPRVITYNSSQLPSGLPAAFEFSSRVIFCVNCVPKKNDAFNAVVSRCDVFELSADTQEILELMRSVSAKGFHGVSAEECERIIDYIAENCEDRQVSMRLLGPSIRKYLYARQEGLDWRPLVHSQLQALGRKCQTTKRLESKSHDVRLLREAISRHPDSPKDQMAYFCSKSQKSKATYYRILARYRDESAE